MQEINRLNIYILLLKNKKKLSIYLDSGSTSHQKSTSQNV